MLIHTSVIIVLISSSVNRHIFVEQSVAIPCVAPIALGGFYSFNGMDFYEYMEKKLHFMFGNKALTYVSTEGEPIIKAFEMEQNGQVKKKGKKINQRLQHLSRQ